MARPDSTEDGQSYQTGTIQLIRDLASRAGNVLNKDEDFVNIFFELIQDKQSQDSRSFVVKRSGTSSLIASQVSSEIRGMYFWEDEQQLFYCANKHIYIYKFSDSSLTTLSNAFSTTSGDVGFTSFLYDDNTVVVIATDGTTLNKITAAHAITACTDPDLPGHQPYPLFLDGYLFLVKTATSDIYNSDLNDPMSWTSGDFISAEMSPDLLLRISKVNNYIVAMGSESVEYFYDAANVSGSPLARNDSPIKINAYLGGLSQYGNDIFYIGKSAGGQPSLFTLKDFNIEEIASPTIKRYLNFVTTAKSTWKTNVIAFQGHTFILIYAGDRSFVVDLENKLWGRWAFQNTELFNMLYSVRVTTTSSEYNVFALSGASSQVYRFDDRVYQDVGTNFTCQIITEQSNFGTLNRKVMARWALLGDRTPANSNIEIYWTDDDFQSYQGPRLVNLNQDLQSCHIMGSFRQRAFKLKYTDNYLLRLQRIEVDINKGIS